MWLAASVNTPAHKQVKSALVQIEQIKPTIKVETLPLSQSHWRTNPATPPTLVLETKLS